MSYTSLQFTPERSTQLFDLAIQNSKQFHWLNRITKHPFEVIGWSIYFSAAQEDERRGRKQPIRCVLSGFSVEGGLEKKNQRSLEHYGGVADPLTLEPFG